jgi:23S rRNA (guanine745-N1)-methyltransferase
MSPLLCQPLCNEAAVPAQPPSNPASPAEQNLNITCPICFASLEQLPKAWRCPAGHSFDVAREGYVNLLPVQQKKSLEPGDSLEMLKARRDFLGGGHYRPMLDALVETLSPLQAKSLLDIGCGEGYYTSALTGAAPEVIGLDIAKPAIQLAARRFKNVTWLVASGAALPIADRSIDIVCNIFTQLHVRQMYRVLQPEGHVLIVSPALEHLWSLREQLFDEVHAHEPEKFLETFSPLFQMVTTRTVKFPLALDQTALRQLLMMTPYAWKAKPEKRSALEHSEGLKTEAAFSLMLFRKVSNSQGSP